MADELQEPKPTVETQPDALTASLKRLEQLAKGFAPALIELARGTQCGVIQPTRPGLRGSAYLIGQIIIARAQHKVLRDLLITAGLLKDKEEYKALVATRLDTEMNVLAEKLNDGSLDMRHPFEFHTQPEEKS